MKNGVIVETMMISRTEKTCIFNPDRDFGIHNAELMKGAKDAAMKTAQVKRL
jgi:hypothetical protein